MRIKCIKILFKIFTRQLKKKDIYKTSEWGKWEASWEIQQPCKINMLNWIKILRNYYGKWHFKRSKRQINDSLENICDIIWKTLISFIYEMLLRDKEPTRKVSKREDLDIHMKGIQWATHMKRGSISFSVKGNSS